MQTVTEVSGPASSTEACALCGHPWGAHVMHPAVYPYPTDGWIACPVNECSCRSTWSVDEAARPVFEGYRAEFFKRVAEGGPLPDGVGMELWYYRHRDEQWRVRDESGAPDSRWLREFDALYLFGTLGMEAVLRGNGEVWVRPDGDWGDATVPEPQWRPADARERNASLVIASKRIPEVRSLLPTRPTDVGDCARCGGSGWFVEAVVCPDCDGLGWLGVQAT